MPSDIAADGDTGVAVKLECDSVESDGVDSRIGTLCDSQVYRSSCSEGSKMSVLCCVVR
jgi:hypothetical protein